MTKSMPIVPGRDALRLPLDIYYRKLMMEINI